MNAAAPSQVTRPMVVQSTKSSGIQILLVLFLGPFGLFYSTIKGALIMIFGVPVAAGMIAVLGAFGQSPLAVVAAYGLILIGWWIGSFVWGVLAVKSYNRKLLQGVATNA